MAAELTGRSALLKREIDMLERKREIIRSSLGGVLGSETLPDVNGQRLEELRRELKLETERKRVVVFATDHRLQEKGHPSNSELERRLSFLIDRFAATVVMEEWAADRPPSFASIFADGRVAYEDVGTPSEQQFRTFCNAPINYPGHDGTLGPCEDAPPVYEYGPLDKQENREQRMTQNIQDKMNGHRVGLFIVGLGHIHSISLKLRQANFNVAAYIWLG